MKITIQYRIDHDGMCFAQTLMCGAFVCAAARTFEEAEANLLAKLKDYKAMPAVPAPKEVEI